VIVYSKDQEILEKITEIDHEVHGLRRMDRSTFMIFWFINTFEMKAETRHNAFKVKLVSTDGLTVDLERNADAF
jgi:hypothetical protein